MSDLGGTMATAFGAATILGLIFSPASAVASLVGGVVSDKIGLKRSLLYTAIIMVAAGVLLLLGNFTGGAFLLVLGLACGGFSYGAQMTIAATATRVLFGNKSYGQAYSFVNASIGIGALCGIVAGTLIDAMAGAFSGVFFFIFALSVGGTLVSLAIIRQLNKQS